MQDKVKWRHLKGGVAVSVVAGLLLVPTQATAAPVVERNAGAAAPVAVAASVDASAGELEALRLSEALASGFDDVQSIRVGQQSQALDVPAKAEQGLGVGSAAGSEVTLGLPAAGQAVQLSSNTVAYDADSDSADVLVQKLDPATVPGAASAVRALISIGAADADTEYRFPVDLAAGSKLVKNADGTVAAIDRAQRVVGAFGKPWAYDATGKSVPTSYRVDGNTLIQTVHHSGAAYPVVADPVWFVPVIIAGARVATPIIVRAATQTAAKKAAVNVAKQTAKKKPVKVGNGTKKLNYKTRTKVNARHNLIVKTGKNPKNCQAHHTIPVKFEPAVRSKVNIHEVKYLVWWNSTKGRKNNHQSMARQYNNDWENWLKANPNPSKAKIEAKQKQMHNKYKKFYGC